MASAALIAAVKHQVRMPVLAGLTIVGVLAAGSAHAGTTKQKLLITPTGFDFGDVPVGAVSPDQIATITNVSGAPLLVLGSDNLISDIRNFVAAQNCQERTLAPGESCGIFISFRPKTVGTVTASLTGAWSGQSYSMTFRGRGFRAEPGDFDGDGKADIAHYRVSQSDWRFLKSGSNYAEFGEISLGFFGRPVPGDYDGDGRTDLAVFTSDGQWIWDPSSIPDAGTLSRHWGISTDVPVPGDYDGDGKTDHAVFRPSDGTWYIVNSSTGTPRYVQWGIEGDVPVRADFDGDGKSDIAVFRPSDGTWYIIRSSSGAAYSVRWGTVSDLTVPADYDGDGSTDIAVFRPSDGIWYIIHSSTGVGVAAAQWGNATDITVPADYDADGKTDIAVYRPSEVRWYILLSSSGSQFGIVWGAFGDMPIPSTLFGRWTCAFGDC